VIPRDEEGFLQIGRAKGHGHLPARYFPIYPEYCLMRKFFSRAPRSLFLDSLRPRGFSGLLSGNLCRRFPIFPVSVRSESAYSSRRGISHDLRSRLR
jgi:hypothetical protein